MLYKLSEGTAARRRVLVGVLVDATDGFTPETGEAAGQPQLSKNGGAWANTTATLVSIGNGRYYVELTAAELDTVGRIAVRYKSAATREYQTEGLSVVAFDPYTSGSTPASAAEVWASVTRTLTQSAAQVAATVAGQTITVFRGDDLSIAITGLGNLGTPTKVWFTAKAVGQDVADTAAELAVDTGGLRTVHAVAQTTTNGSVVVNDATAGNITVTVAAVASLNLVPGTYTYDIQVLKSSPAVAVLTISSGTFVISTDITKAVS